MKKYETLFSHTAKSIETPCLRQVTLKVAAVNGINLGQGTCLLPVPPIVIQAAKNAIDAGINRYTISKGLPSIRQAVATKLREFNGISCDPETELNITQGVTGAFEGICLTLINPGDEVISFEPRYPYHHNALKRFGATISYVTLEGDDWTFDREQLSRSFSSKTKFLLLNTPSNPCGKVFTREELEYIGELCERHDTLLVTDEIYEYITFDGREHISPASLPKLKDRTITMGGYSKTFAITGWRIGYVVAPKVISEKITQLLDSVYVCPPAPFQQAVADSLAQLGVDFYQSLQKKYQAKRDFFSEALRECGLEVLKPQGTYYMLANYAKRFPNMSSKDFVDLLIEKTHVGAVPVDDFVKDPQHQRWVRFCLAVEDDVLTQASNQLRSL